MKTSSVMIPFCGAFDRWYIRNSYQPDMAWTGARWARHINGLPREHFQICNFDSRGAAQKYIDCFPLPLLEDGGC
jgi:hypothetical protein